MKIRRRSQAQYTIPTGMLIIVSVALGACVPIDRTPSAKPTDLPSALPTPLPEATAAPTPSVAVLWDEGLASVRNGDLAAAEVAFEAALALAPDDAGLYYQLGTLSIERGEFQSAAQALGRAITLDDTNAEAFLKLGQTQRTLGNLEEAEHALSEARGLDPTNPRVYYHLGLVYRDQGAFELAIEAFEQYLSMVPDEAPDQAAATGAVKELQDEIDDRWLEVSNQSAGFSIAYPKTWTYIQEGPRLILTQHKGGVTSPAAAAATVVFEMWSAEKLRAELNLTSLQDPAEVVLAAAGGLGTPADQVQRADFDGHPAALVDLSAEVRGARYDGTLAVILLEDRVLRVDGAGPAREWPAAHSICIDMINSVDFTD